LSYKELICRGEIPTLNFVEAAYDPFNTQVEYRAPCMSEVTDVGGHQRHYPWQLAKLHLA